MFELQELDHNNDTTYDDIGINDSISSKISLEITLKADRDDFDTWYHSFDKQIEELNEFVANGESIDAYQMNSFYSGIPQMRYKCISNYYKTFALVCIQIMGIVYLGWEQATKQFGGDHIACNISDFGPKSWIAFAFVGFISLTLCDQLKDMAKFGMYGFKSNLPPFLNRFWIAVGILINVFVILLSWGISVCIIFLSREVLDMILNSLAVYFIVELDDEMVSFVDYEHIGDFLENDYYQFMKLKYQRIQMKGYEPSIWEMWGRKIIKCSTFANSKVFIWSVNIAAFLVPFYVLLCFDENFAGGNGAVPSL